MNVVCIMNEMAFVKIAGRNKKWEIDKFEVQGELDKKLESPLWTEHHYGMYPKKGNPSGSTYNLQANISKMPRATGDIASIERMTASGGPADERMRRKLLGHVMYDMKKNYPNVRYVGTESKGSYKDGQTVYDFGRRYNMPERALRDSDPEIKWVPDKRADPYDKKVIATSPYGTESNNVLGMKDYEPQGAKQQKGNMAELRSGKKQHVKNDTIEYWNNEIMADKKLKIQNFIKKNKDAVAPIFRKLFKSKRLGG